jgi:hypothetical protein
VRTDELTALLARGNDAPQDRPARRYATAVASGAFTASLLMALTLGVRADILQAALLPAFWLKLAFPGALAAACLVAVMRLSRPGAPLAILPPALSLPVIAVWLAAAAALAEAEPAIRLEMVFTPSWQSCPLLIAALSAPALAAALWALNGMAPTRLALAGGAAGLLAGTLGALAYALHCPETALPFIALWYSLGMLIPAAAGALLAAALLRW